MMNRQHIWKIVPLVLLLTSMAWWVQAQSASQSVDAASDSSDDVKIQLAVDKPASSDGDLTIREVIVSDGQVTEYFDQVTRSVPASPAKVPEPWQYSWDGVSPQDKEREMNRLLEKNIHDVIRKYRSANGTKEREAMRKSLAIVLRQQFKIRQSLRQHELDKLNQELTRLKALQKRRDDHMKDIVAARVESLIRDADGLGWGSSSSKQSYTGGTGDAIWTYGSKTNGSGGRRRGKLETFPSEALPTPRPQ